MIGRDVHEKRNRKRKVGRRVGHNEGIKAAGSGSRNVLPRLKQLKTHRPKRPEQQNEIAVYRAGRARQPSSNQNNTTTFQNHIPSSAQTTE